MTGNVPNPPRHNSPSPELPCLNLNKACAVVFLMLCYTCYVAHFLFHYLVENRYQPLYLVALFFVEVEVDVIEQLVSLLIGHVAAIAESGDGDGGQLTGIYT